MSSLLGRGLAAACSLIVAACFPESATAPPATADVATEALPETYGLEYGTITFTPVRGDDLSCDVKIALRNLFVDFDDIDYYHLYIGTVEAPYPTPAVWTRQIVNSQVSRGTFRGEGYTSVSKTHLQASNLYLGLAFYLDETQNGTDDGWYRNDSQIAQFKVGGMEQIDFDFKVVNRCF